jgi:hypothetical protein
MLVGIPGNDWPMALVPAQRLKANRQYENLRQGFIFIRYIFAEPKGDPETPMQAIRGLH